MGCSFSSFCLTQFTSSAKTNQIRTKLRGPFCWFLFGFCLVFGSCANQPRTKYEPNSRGVLLVFAKCLLGFWFAHEPTTNQKRTKYEPNSGGVFVGCCLVFAWLFLVFAWFLLVAPSTSVCGSLPEFNVHVWAPWGPCELNWGGVFVGFCLVFAWCTNQPRPKNEPNTN